MAFLQSQPPREPFLHVPASVLWFIAVLVGIHLFIVLAPDTLAEAVVSRFAFVPLQYAQGGGAVALAVPFVGHMFLHADFTHLAVNCLWLLAPSPYLVRRYGTMAFLLLFTISGIAGAALYLALNWGSPVPMIGASGGISGLMAAGIRMLRWPGVAPGRALAPLLSRPILVITALWVVTNAIFGYLGLGAGDDAQQIAWQAHLGGYFCGLFLIDGIEAWRRR